MRANGSTWAKLAGPFGLDWNLRRSAVDGKHGRRLGQRSGGDRRREAEMIGEGLVARPALAIGDHHAAEGVGGKVDLDRVDVVRPDLEIGPDNERVFDVDDTGHGLVDAVLHDSIREPPAHPVDGADRARAIAGRCRADQDEAARPDRALVLESLHDVDRAPGHVFDDDARMVCEPRLERAHQLRPERIAVEDRREADDPDQHGRWRNARSRQADAGLRPARVRPVQ